MRRLLITSSVLARVKLLVKEGVSAADIAQQVGCTVGTLRVRCSQNRISLRRGAGQIAGSRSALVQHPSNGTSELARPGSQQRPLSTRVELKVFVPKFTAERLQQRAALTGTTGAMLAARLLTTIDRDSLYDAVLDVDLPPRQLHGL